MYSDICSGLNPPFTAVYRRAKGHENINGEDIAQGTHVLLSLAAANADVRRTIYPYEFMLKYVVAQGLWR
jgi:cytochrome P450